MSKFRTKKIVEINEAARGTYDTNSQIKFITPLLTLKRLGSGGGGGQFEVLCCFPKKLYFRVRVKPCFFVTFNIIVSHIFPENFVDVSHIAQRIRRFSPSILTIFIDFSDFLNFSSRKETSDFSIQQMISSIFYFQAIINSLFNNFINLYWYWISSSGNMKVGRRGKLNPSPLHLLPQKENCLQKSQLYQG